MSEIIPVPSRGRIILESGAAGFVLAVGLSTEASQIAASQPIGMFIGAGLLLTSTGLGMMTHADVEKLKQSKVDDQPVSPIQDTL